MQIDLKQYDSLPHTEHKVPKHENASIWDFLNKDIQLFGTQLSMKKKETFYAEMEVLLNAGLDLKTALELVEEGHTKPKERLLFNQIKETVVQGENLSDALAQSTKFSPYEVFSVRIAEESGKLPPILADLSNYFAKNLQYRRLLTSALSYPILVIGVSILALVFLLNFLVPLFGDIYTRLNQDLPTVTLIIISLSEIVQNYIGYAISFFLIFSAFLYSQRKKARLRNWGAKIILHIPVFGTLIRQVYLARFAQAIAFLLGAKVPLLQALELVQKMVGFYPIESSLNAIGENILKGKPLHKSMQAFSIYPRRMVALIKVGEEANHLEEMFTKLASQYNDEVEQRTKMLGSLIEPVLIVFLAVVVGLVLVSMYMPIFKLVTNFGG